ncbi:MAG: aldose epimerase family protein, partial [Tannerellaceae bacterium]
IGRYGNRIGNAQFALDGTTYNLPKNNDEHCLHGGPDGYHNVVWEAKQLDDQTLQLTYTSPDGDAGFPGKLDMTVIYRLTDKNAVDIQYKAVTDKKTIVNLTNHSYFNLSGKHNENILDHVLMINADMYTPIDDTFITTGEITQVEGTPMDFRKPNVIGDRIDDSFQQLQYGKGYDHNWVLNTKGNLKQAAAQAYSKESGIVMSVYTTEPGIQFYAGNFMEGDVKGKHGVVYPHRGALCLETQHYPDSPNKADFPSVVVKPGDVYTSRCIYSFGVQK